MKRFQMILLSFLIMITFLGCGVKDVELHSDNQLEMPSTPIPSLSHMLQNDWNGIPEPLKLPAESLVEWGIGTYYSDISKEEIEKYLIKLEKAGWTSDQKFRSELELGTTNYVLFKENELLQMMIIIKDTEFDLANSLLLRYDNGISNQEIMDRKGALTREEAKELIQSKVLELMERGEIASTNRGEITGIFEILIEEAFEKMQLQAYAAISDNGLTGCFLICNEDILMVPGYLNNTCVADLDKDGTYELLDLYGWGSGIYRINLSAYSYSNPIYFSSRMKILHRQYGNCFVPNKGYDELWFQKRSDHSVQMVGKEKEYGFIKVKDFQLIVDPMEDFPFTLWGEAYDQRLLREMEKELPTAPPEITIYLKDEILDYQIHEVKWEGVDIKSELSQDSKADIVSEKSLPTVDSKEDNNLPSVDLKEENLPSVELKEGNFPSVDLKEGNNLPNVDLKDEYNIVINFGKHIPDSIVVYDTIRAKDGTAFANGMKIEHTVKILDNQSVSFPLEQHMAYYLSSNTNDYKKDWLRRFEVVCSWGENKCSYVFEINTRDSRSMK